MKVDVEVWQSAMHMWTATLMIDRTGCMIESCDGYITHFTMNHDDPVERRRLGEGCADAFAAGQCVVTYHDKEPA